MAAPTVAARQVVTWELLEHATGPAALARAAESWRVAYPSTSITGAPTRLTGLMHLPAGAPPAGGWPVVTYGHMTTGGGDRAAPSLATPGHPELRRMGMGDAVCNHLVSGGAVVLRPDFEGLGSPGRHPYLVGSALASSTVDMLAAARAGDERLGSAWVSAGHSEGSMAALWAARRGQPLPAGVELRGISAFSPVTRLGLTIGGSFWVPWPPGTRVVTPLVALMISGAATVDPRIAELVDGGEGLSLRARAVWHHLEQRSLAECVRRDSFGAFTAGSLPARGRLGRELRHRVLAVLDAQDPRHLDFRPVPIRVDIGMLDENAPWPLSLALVRTWRRAGHHVEAHHWPAWHCGVMGERFAALPAARWILQRLA